MTSRSSSSSTSARTSSSSTPRCQSDEFDELVDRELPEDDYETVGGFVIAQLDKIPTAGDVVHFEDMAFTVLGTKGRRVTKVRVVRQAPEAAQTTGNGQEARQEARAGRSGEEEGEQSLDSAPLNIAEQRALRPDVTSPASADVPARDGSENGAAGRRPADPGAPSI